MVKCSINLILNHLPLSHDIYCIMIILYIGGGCRTALYMWESIFLSVRSCATGGLLCKRWLDSRCRYGYIYTRYIHILSYILFLLRGICAFRIVLYECDYIFSALHPMRRRGLHGALYICAVGRAWPPYPPPPPRRMG